MFQYCFRIFSFFHFLENEYFRCYDVIFRQGQRPWFSKKKTCVGKRCLHTTHLQCLHFKAMHIQHSPILAKTERLTCLNQTENGRFEPLDGRSPNSAFRQCLISDDSGMPGQIEKECICQGYLFKVNK